MQSKKLKSVKVTPQALEHLKKIDSKMFDTIQKFGIIERFSESDEFSVLANCIVAQQISTKAADNIWERLKETLIEINFKTIISTDSQSLRKCGLSERKVSYLKSIAQKVESKILNFQKLKKLTDKQIQTELVKLDGVGEWTAEMMLIFAFERPDVFSLKDFGIRKGLSILYKTDDMDFFKDMRKKYSPFATAASFYLWEVALQK